MSEHYEVVDDDEPLEEGQTYVSIYEMEVPGWIPKTSVEDQLIGTGLNLTTQINDELPGRHQVNVTNRELELVEEPQNGPRVYEYRVTYDVVNVDPDAPEPLTSSLLHVIIYGAIFILGVAGVAFALRETRMLLETEGGGVALGGMLLIGAAAVGLIDTENDGGSGS